MVITLPVTDAPYLGFQLGSLWYISLDYINHQTSLNGTQAQADPDGKIRIVETEFQSFSADFLNIIERDILRVERRKDEVRRQQ